MRPSGCYNATCTALAHPCIHHKRLALSQSLDEAVMRSDASPKVRIIARHAQIQATDFVQALIKAAIRSKCHVIAERYGDEGLDLHKLHGSHVRWLVLSEELFTEVCSEFTVQKLDMNVADKRAIFDLEWVPQVTYELVTKPGRPRRRRRQFINSNSATYSTQSAESDMISPRNGRIRKVSMPATVCSRMNSSNKRQRTPTAQVLSMAPDLPSKVSLPDYSNLQPPSVQPPAIGERKNSASSWIDTVLN